MNSPVSNPYAGSQLPTCVPACHYSDSHFISGLGVVLLIFGAAIFHHSEATMIGLALLVIAPWFD